MRSILMTGVAAAMLLSGAAHAATVYNTSLPALNGANGGGGVATTTTNANGTVTTVTGPSGGAARTSASLSHAITDKWLQANVGAEGSVGITKTYANSGNGSVYFDGPTAQNPGGSGSKADLEYYFSTPMALSDFVGATFDWYRDVSSDNNPIQAPAFRLLVNDAGQTKNNNTALIFEDYYQGAPHNAIEGAWQTSAIGLSSMVHNNSALISPVTPGFTRPLQEWIDANPGLLIYGLSIGIGSGWDGHFTGAVDNVGYAIGTSKALDNFEVATAPVPEPATWAMMIGGFAFAGAAMRRRKANIAFA